MMIALDTNAVVRMLIEDDESQAKAIQEIVSLAEKNSIQIIVLPEVLIETVWVLESLYACARNEISKFLETLVSTSTFSLPDFPVVRKAVQQYRKKGDFADLLIVGQARKQGATKFVSFDKKLQKMFPGYVVGRIGKGDI